MRFSSCFSLVILTSRVQVTRGLFCDGPRNFEPRTDDKDDSFACIPLFKLPHYTSVRTFDFLRMIQRVTGRTVTIFSEIRFRAWKTSGSEPDTLPLGHCVLVLR
ncbi:hypothetical protein AVEN_46311-1 [Araneus ventricosus]|uniref:Secreted protein n=1 Tax=Araneus ventricosus TaxID=182803 RepID=A0A4Y2KAS9_ARAVE|nr:hypothetical protein AVEN_46311-1 [Araneus ventricosus]